MARQSTDRRSETLGLALQSMRLPNSLRWLQRHGLFGRGEAAGEERGRRILPSVDE